VAIVWSLVEMHEQIIDRDVPMSFATVWRRLANPGRSPSKGLDKPASERE